MSSRTSHSDLTGLLEYIDNNGTSGMNDEDSDIGDWVRWETSFRRDWRRRVEDDDKWRRIVERTLSYMTTRASDSITSSTPQCLSKCLAHVIFNYRRHRGSMVPLLTQFERCGAVPGPSMAVNLLHHLCCHDTEGRAMDDDDDCDSVYEKRAVLDWTLDAWERARGRNIGHHPSWTATVRRKLNCLLFLVLARRGLCPEADWLSSKGAILNHHQMKYLFNKSRNSDDWTPQICVWLVQKGFRIDQLDYGWRHHLANILLLLWSHDSTYNPKIAKVYTCLFDWCVQVKFLGGIFILYRHFILFLAAITKMDGPVTICRWVAENDEYITNKTIVMVEASLSEERGDTGDPWDTEGGPDDIADCLGPPFEDMVLPCRRDDTNDTIAVTRRQAGGEQESTRRCASRLRSPNVNESSMVDLLHRSTRAYPEGSGYKEVIIRRGFMKAAFYYHMMCPRMDSKVAGYDAIPVLYELYQGNNRSGIDQVLQSGPSGSICCLNYNINMDERTDALQWIIDHLTDGGKPDLLMRLYAKALSPGCHRFYWPALSLFHHIGARLDEAELSRLLYENVVDYFQRHDSLELLRVWIATYTRRWAPEQQQKEVESVLRTASINSLTQVLNYRYGLYNDLEGTISFPMFCAIFSSARIKYLMDFEGARFANPSKTFVDVWLKEWSSSCPSDRARDDELLANSGLLGQYSTEDLANIVSTGDCAKIPQCVLDELKERNGHSRVYLTFGSSHHCAIEVSQNLICARSDVISAGIRSNRRSREWQRTFSEGTSVDNNVIINNIDCSDLGISYEMATFLKYYIETAYVNIRLSRCRDVTMFRDVYDKLLIDARSKNRKCRV